ncbi:alpha/beta hydrolase [Streptomyces regalis]|uniref:alpha/beta hydrolase n=1 Tax=Streptomyces regalis TaxID=68262 RepID=UPI002446702D|nr:alpha/beta hydrolase [Streptomyces regalis]
MAPRRGTGRPHRQHGRRPRCTEPGDPQTPLPGGRAMHRALHGSRLVYVRGGRGHAVYGFPGAPACVPRTVDAYLTDGRLPTTDVTCDS